jgi:hypothetical protein
VTYERTCTRTPLVPIANPWGQRGVMRAVHGPSSVARSPELPDTGNPGHWLCCPLCSSHWRDERLRRFSSFLVACSGHDKARRG